MPLTAVEQYLLELINRARLDLAAEARCYNLNLNDGLSPGEIGADSLHPLVYNEKLVVAVNRDANHNSFYFIGEGQQGLTIWGRGDRETTAVSGGYALGVAAQDDVHLTVAKGGGGALAQLEIDTSDGNVKLDVVTKTKGGLSLNLSGSTPFVDGIENASLSGTGDLYLTGQGGRNRLHGNSGDNKIVEGRGADRLWGDDGAHLAGDLSLSDMLEIGHIDHGDAVLDFGYGDVLIVEHVRDMAILANDLIII
jgi:Ca2+-binding RTX toxin-like protein